MKKQITKMNILSIVLSLYFLLLGGVLSYSFNIVSTYSTATRSESFNFSEYDDFYNENFDSHLDELFAESGESDTNSSSSAYEIDVNEPIGASQEDGDDEEDEDDDIDFVDDDEDFIPLLEDEITERLALMMMGFFLIEILIIKIKLENREACLLIPLFSCF